MRKIVKQTVVLSARPRELYSMYLNRRAHGAITGHDVEIGARGGARFKAFDGALTGRILQLVPGKLIVQAWRSGKFHKSDADSTLILHFSSSGKNGRIDLVHVNVPDHDYRGVNEGWKKYYWAPWSRYLAARRKKRGR